MKVGWDDDIPNIWKNKSHVPNHQPNDYSPRKCQLWIQVYCSHPRLGAESHGSHQFSSIVLGVPAEEVPSSGIVVAKIMGLEPFNQQKNEFPGNNEDLANKKFW